MAEPTGDRDGRRSTFGPAVLGGLAAGGLAALAGSRDWVRLDDGGSGDAAFAGTGSGADLTAPPVTAVALVLLAAWGVLLVTRGRPRVAVAWLALAAAVAVLGFAGAAWIGRPDDVADQLARLDLTVGRSVWAHLGVVAGLLAVATSVLAVRDVRRWPEMGRRYDAPAAGAVAADDVPTEERSSLDLWKALDEGHDPTDPTDPSDRTHPGAP